MTIKITGPWSLETVQTYLGEVEIPVQLAALNNDNLPVLISLWFSYENNHIWCATQRDAHIVKLLIKNPSCAFQISSEHMPYKGVRGQATASIIESDGARILDTLVTKYLKESDSKFAKWLTSRKANEVAIQLDLVSMATWDFSGRMVNS
jgi:nitroimidazol reductase NimA-like FMN-containing flavoprotein (pyridoxamine 5'-phosphate oxidase superfamily)|tara:strand:+ start:1247 stop:1696 length:450 start_codon:yes stop_codon:yes gene_type:complete